jgi:hypothetical protein
MTKAQVKTAFDTAEEYGSEPPRPLMRELPEPDPFPVDALGSVLGDAARATHDKTQAPLPIRCQSVLAAATLATQAHADIELPTGQRRPLSAFFISIAATGERKSACDQEALLPIRKREANLRTQYDIDLEPWRNDMEAWEKQRQQILGDKGKHGDRASKKAALDTLGPAPDKPLFPMLRCDEPTLEGLAKLYAISHPSLGIFSAEGGQFIAGHGMNAENKLKTAAGLSKIWDGEPITRVRAGDGSMTLPGRRLCLHLMVQPDVASVMLSDAVLMDQGMLSRMLVSAPESTAGTRLWRDPVPESDQALRQYGACLLAIMERPLALAEGKPNELVPRVLSLSHEARQVWTNFADHIERQIGPGGEMEPIKGLANKLPEHAARLAGVLALVEDIEAHLISTDHLAAGIALADYYAAEALRLFAAGRTDPDLLLAQRTLDWLRDRWTEDLISLPDFYRLGPNRIRDGRTAKRIAKILQEHGWLDPVDGGATINGQRRREVWRIRRA